MTPEKRREWMRSVFADAINEALTPRTDTEKLLHGVLCEARDVLAMADIRSVVVMSDVGDESAVVGLAVNIGSRLIHLVALPVQSFKGGSAEDVVHCVKDALRRQLSEIGPLAMLTAERPGQ